MLSVAVFILNILMLTILKAAGYAENPYAIIVAIAVQSIAIIINILTAKEEMHKIRFQLLSAYLARVAILAIDIYGKAYIRIPQSGADSRGFYNNAIAVMNYSPNWEDTNFYCQIMGFLFRFIGSNQLFAQYINLLASMIVIYLIAKILIDLKINDKILIWSMWIICLFPTYTMLSVIFLREVFVSMFVANSVFCFIRYLLRNNLLTLVISFASILPGAAMHAGVLALPIGYIIVLILYNNKEHTFTFNIIGILSSIVLALVFLFIVVQTGDTFTEKLNKVESIDDVANTNDAGGSSYAQYVGNSNNPLSMVIFTIPRIVFFLFSPMPFQWRNPVDAITFVCGSALYLTSVYFSIKAIKNSDNKLYKSLVISLLIIAFCGVFVFGWGVSNTGTALRHRDKLFSIFAILLGISWSAWYDSGKAKLKRTEKGKLDSDERK